MGLFNRFTDIINANLTNLLDKAEQPEKMIRLIIGEMEETLVDIRAIAAKNIAEQKTLTRQIKSSEKVIAQWQQKAELALSKSREDLAKAALVEKHKYQDELTQYQTESDQLTENLLEIQADAQRLQTKLTEAKHREEGLLRRKESAQVRVKIREKAVMHNIDDAMAKFERYQQKIENLEAKVESYDITDAPTTEQPTDLAAQINELVQNDEIDSAIAAIKIRQQERHQNLAS